MELSREKWLALVADTLVGAIIHIDEKRLPILRKRSVIDGKAMILRSHIAAVRAHAAHRLIMTPVPIFELIDLRARSAAQKLVAHADAAYRLIPLQRLAQILDRHIHHIRIPRTIGKEDPFA